MIDSHCHLADPKFEKDIAEVVARARNAGVSPMVAIADSLEEAQKCLSLAEKFDDVYCTIGVHPHHASAFESERDLNVMRGFVKEHVKCRAIGEIGLDYYYETSSKGVQRNAFDEQLKLAKALNLAAVVHSRDAIEDTWSIVDKIRPGNLVLHCCTEKWKNVKRFVDAGYFLSFTGIATYPKSDDIRDTIRQCPLEKMMIETDSPYLAPIPHRGERNEPAFVVEVTKCIAQVKNIPLKEVDRVTTENALDFFGI